MLGVERFMELSSQVTLNKDGSHCNLRGAPSILSGIFTWRFQNVFAEYGVVIALAWAGQGFRLWRRRSVSSSSSS